MRKAPPDISIKKIKKGIILFILLTFAGIATVFYRSRFYTSVTHLREFDVLYLVIAFSLVLLAWLVDGTRIYVYAEKIQKDISFIGCMRAGLANIFMGGITPSQTGGGAAQIYILYKEGLKLIDATVVSFLNFFNSVVILLVCGITINLFANPEHDIFMLEIISNLTLFVFGIILLVVTLPLIIPLKIEGIVQTFFGFNQRAQKWLDKKGGLHSFMNSVNEYRTLMMHFLKYKKKVIGYGFILTAILYFNYCLIAYVVLIGLGLSVPFWQVIYLQILIILGFYFLPTPGASGGAEFIIGIFMVDIGNLLPVAYLGAFTVLWRSFTLYTGMLGGAYVLLRLILKNNREAKPG